MKIIETNSREETLALGKSLGQQAIPGSIFCLKGDLGCGKTVFAKGIAQGLGVTQDVISPTFLILREYAGQRSQGRLPFYHFDIYRLQDEEALLDIGFDEFTGRGGVCLIEWADQLSQAMPEDSLWIEIQKDPEKGEDFRRILIYEKDEKPC